MRKLILAQNSFAFGEISPDARGRDDIKAYAEGSKALENYNLLQAGGVERRWGTEHIALLQGLPRLFEFEFSETQQYIFVFTNLRLDVWSLDDSDPAVLPVTTFVETITTNADWTEALLKTLHQAQSGDTMFLADGTGTQVMKKIVRTSATTFAISDFDFEEHSAGQPKYQPYFKFSDPAVTMAPGATTGSGVALVASDDVFVAGHVGLIFRLTDDPATDTPKEVLITGVTDATNAVITVRETLDGITATTEWDEPVFSAVRGWQREVKLGEQRLIIAGSRDLPHASWLSNTSAFFKFDAGTGEDDEMIDRAIDSGIIEEIRGVIVSDNIEIFTDRGEHYMPLSETKFITPATAALRNQTTFGMVANVQPRAYDGATLYVQHPGMVLREYLWNDAASKYESPPVSLLATHLFQNTANNVEIPADIRGSAVINATRRRPESYWFTINNGTGQLIQFHSIRAEKVSGFSRWITDGDFVDVAVVGHVMYVATKREVAGDVWDDVFADDFGRDNTLYYLERVEPEFSLDFAQKVEVAIPSTTFAGLTHLANRTVHVVSRNAIYHGTFDVNASGEVTINEKETEIVAGLDYTTRIKTLRPRFTAQGYTISGQIKRLINIVIEMSNVYNLVPAGNNLLIRKVTDDLGLDPTAIDGQREFNLRGYSRAGEVEILQDAPLPVRILSYQLTIGV